ncbi:hypothetical protein OOT46_03730 [Aquabacterium sp. A7-Y]|uniref:hypothetical protein n=1 Tax=Aquabacterium sp. A7-Y TaxID=1349605 RepID=UPI00223DB1F9|nr:hypothetical protein [Aquabacterium sp. A7-Y]MCW7536963.1 hypothetical protein [Aquabacterium sp. A7-Y]
MTGVPPPSRFPAAASTAGVASVQHTAQPATASQPAPSQTSSADTAASLQGLRRASMSSEHRLRQAASQLPSGPGIGSPSLARRDSTDSQSSVDSHYSTASEGSMHSHYTSLSEASVGSHYTTASEASHYSTATEGSTASTASSSSASSASSQPPQLTPEHAMQALKATFVQRGITHLSAQLGTWVSQVGAVAGAAAAGVNPQQLGLTSQLVSGAVSAALKEVVGEHLKTKPAYSATIDLPSNTTGEWLAPKVMAGANDMLAGIASSLSNAAIGAKLTPAIQQGLEKAGLNPAVALPVAMMLTAVVQRLVSATADTASDVASTAMKTRFSGAQGSHKVNDGFDTATMLGGMAARGMINFGLTLPVGVPAALGKLMEHGTAVQKAAASNAMAWAGLNGWIVAKSVITDKIKEVAPNLAANTVVLPGPGATAGDAAAVALHPLPARSGAGPRPADDMV